MSSFSTTRLSSKGQLVIPESIRIQMGLKTGTEFVVAGEKDILVLKILAPPDLNKFRRQIQQARSGARKATLKKAMRPAGGKRGKKKQR